MFINTCKTHLNAYYKLLVINEKFHYKFKRLLNIFGKNRLLL